MVISIDGVRLGKKPTGVTDITISIINAFSTNYPEITLYVFVNKELHPETEKKIFKHNNLRILIKPLPFLKNNGLLWTLLKLNQLVKFVKPDLFIEPNFLFNPILFPKKTKVVTYIHDVVFKERPETMEFISRLYMTLFLKLTFKRTNIVWTNSFYTAERLKYYYGSILKHQFFFNGSGINPFFTKRVKQIDLKPWDEGSLRQATANKYLLFVGTIEPRKNIPFLLELFSALKDESYRLIIAGDKGWGAASKETERILERDGFPKDKVLFAGYVSSDDLIRLYKNASIFISASQNEGLGIPQLEAMACGCPVLSPHNSAMIEVVEGAGITVKSWDLAEWLFAIKTIENDREFYIKKGYEKLKNYNWNIVVQEFYAAFLDSVNKEI